MSKNLPQNCGSAQKAVNYFVKKHPSIFSRVQNMSLLDAQRCYYVSSHRKYFVKSKKRPETCKFIKKDSNSGFFLRNLRNFGDHLYGRTAGNCFCIKTKKFIKFQEKTYDWFPFSIKSCCSKAEVLFRKKCSEKFRCLNLNVWMHRIYVYRIASGLLNYFLNLCFNPLLATASILYPLVFRCYLGV